MSNNIEARINNLFQVLKEWELCKLHNAHCMASEEEMKWLKEKIQRLNSSYLKLDEEIIQVEYEISFILRRN